MTSFQRREQLLTVGRALFASQGFEATSVEEIASKAKVSKPIVYEHFGGKEGLYAVVVDREMQSLTTALTDALSDAEGHPRQIVEKTALALLTYIEEHTEGFKILARDSPTTDPASSFSSLLGEVSMRVEEILKEQFRHRKISTKGVPFYAQMLVGMTVFTGQYWADGRKAGKEQLAAYIVNLAWNGLSRLESKPTLRYEGKHAKTARSEKNEKAVDGEDRTAQHKSGELLSPVASAENTMNNGTNSDTSIESPETTDADRSLSQSATQSSDQSITQNTTNDAREDTHKTKATETVEDTSEGTMQA